MITKFATVYAGHVDIPDRGQDATPANERRFSNAHLASVFDKTEAVAAIAAVVGGRAVEADIVELNLADIEHMEFLDHA